MKSVVARSYRYLLLAAAVVVFLGCDQVKDITSGGGTKDAEPTQTSTGTISAQSSDASQDDASQESESGDESSLKTWGEVLAEAGIENEPEPDSTDEADSGGGNGEKIERGSNEIVIRNTGAKMYWNSYPYDKFVFPKCGPEYTNQAFYIEYSDGNRLDVPSPENMAMTPDNMKYQPGCKWSGNNPDIPTMEVYARKDTHPAWVKAVFKHSVE